MTIADDLRARITQIDAEIARIATTAKQQIAEQEQNKALLVNAVTTLAKVPEAEQLIPALRQMGVL